jgi:hypothetical protein
MMILRCDCHAGGVQLAGTPLNDARRSSRHDPTGTHRMRSALMTELRRRWVQLRVAAQGFLVSQDHLGLGQGPPPVGSLQLGQAPHQKLDYLASWLSNATAAIVVGHGGHWVAPAVGAAYQKGRQDAARHLGLPAPPPPALDRAPTLARLAAHALVGIGDEVHKQVVREVGQVINHGGSPRQAQGALSDRVQHVGMVRSEALANTVLVSAHAYGSLDTYQAAGVTHVALRAEVNRARPTHDARTPRAPVQRTLVAIQTAGDDLVCQECQDLENDNPYRLQEALGLIPAHPNCRCAWVPWGEEEGDEE